MTTNTRRRRTPLLFISLVVGLPVAAGALFVGYLFVSGTPLVDEWHCGKGESPVVHPDGGRACAREDAVLEGDWAWDPLGNRPIVCGSRWGWTKVEPTDVPFSDNAYHTDCVKKGRPIPAGWRRAE